MRRLLAVGLVLALGACTSFEGSTNRYNVFFKEFSAQLDPDANAIVDAAAGFAMRHPEQPLLVAGFADPDGSSQANLDISRTRAQVVFDRLVADGVKASRITRRAHGATPFVDTAQESRRVEIAVGA